MNRYHFVQNLGFETVLRLDFIQISSLLDVIGKETITFIVQLISLMNKTLCHF